jgi:1-pyrroline-5-carboxylate dehydrogenase
MSHSVAAAAAPVAGTPAAENSAVYEATIRAGRRAGPIACPHVIGGEERLDGPELRREDPSFPSCIVSVCHDAPADLVRGAVDTSRAAQREWARLEPVERAARLLAALELLTPERCERIAAVIALETGKTRAAAAIEVEELAAMFRVYCGYTAKDGAFEDPLTPTVGQVVTRSQLRPYGVFGAIVPFNFPAALTAQPTLAALLAGNGVVIKSPHLAPRSSYEFYSLVAELDLPVGLVNIVHGADGPGRELVASGVDGIGFTGSAEVGLSIVSALQRPPYPRPVIAEMGGKNPVIVTDGASIDDAVRGITYSAFDLTGQKCSACSRVLVTSGIHDALVGALAERVQALVFDEPLQAAADGGPLISSAALRRYEDIVAAAKLVGHVVTGGHRLEAEGYFVAPTIAADIPLGHDLARVEHFLPFLTVTKVSSFDEAIAEANALNVGLTAGIFTGDPDEARRFREEIQAGAININNPNHATTGFWPGNGTFGGWMPSNHSTFDVTTAAGLAAIGTLRERFIEDRATDLSGLRPRIARSWRRSAAMGIDPTARPDAIDDGAQVDEQTLQCAAPFVQELERIATDAGGAVTLVSPAGAQVRCLGPYLQDGLAHGLVLLESVCGTNSDGTALEERRSGWVHSREHYLEDQRFQRSSCYSALLCDPLRNTVRAVLGLTLPEAVALRSDLRSVGLLVEGVAAKITRAIAKRSTIREEALLGEYLKAARRYRNAAVLATDGKNTFVTDPALELLREDDFAAISSYAQEALRARHSVMREVMLSGDRPVELHISIAGPTVTPVGAVVHVRPATARRAMRADREHEAVSIAGQADKPTRAFDDLVGDNQAFRQALALATTCVSRRRPAAVIGDAGTGKRSIALRIAQAWSTDTEALECAPPTVDGGSLVEAVRIRLHAGQAVFLRDIDLLAAVTSTSLVELFRQIENPLVVVTLRRPTASAIELMSALHGIEIAMLSLRARREDIPALAKRFIADLTDKRPSGRLLYVLARAEWPGNVAHLKSVAEQAALVARGPEVSVADLPRSFSRITAQGLSRLEQLELHELHTALDEANGNRTLAAKSLQIGRTTLYRRLDSYRRRGIPI